MGSSGKLSSLSSSNLLVEVRFRPSPGAPQRQGIGAMKPLKEAPQGLGRGVFRVVGFTDTGFGLSGIGKGGKKRTS